MPLVDIEDLKVSFASMAARVEAVRGVSFTSSEGESLGIVGEIRFRQIGDLHARCCAFCAAAAASHGRDR